MNLDPQRLPWTRRPLLTALFCSALIGCSDDQGDKSDSGGSASDGAVVDGGATDGGPTDTGSGGDAGGTADDGSSVDDAIAVADTTTGDDATASEDAGTGGDTIQPKPPVEVGGTKGMAVNVLDTATKLKVPVTVTDAGGNAIPGATVTVGATTVKVDGTSVELTGIAIDNSPVLTASAPGHASTSMLLDPMRALGGLRLVLQKHEKVETFAAADGGKLAASAVAVQIPAGGVVDASGKAYTGKVTMAAASIDLDRDLVTGAGQLRANAAAMMPEPVVPADMGGTGAAMLKLASSHVSLTGDSGEALQLAKDKPASVDFKLSPTLAATLPAAYAAGAQLDVISRDEKTGVWSGSAKCTVAKGPSGWTCAAKLPHFSEAAVAQPMKYGCAMVGSLTLSAPAGHDVVWRSQKFKTERNIELRGHFYDNKGEMGMCALVPLDLAHVRVVMDYQTAPAGTPVSDKPTAVAGSVYASRVFDLGKPVDNNLDPSKLDFQSAAGCLAACGGVVPVAVKATPLTVPVPVQAQPIDPGDLPAPPANVELPSVEFDQIDLDKDGSPAGKDCNDSDPVVSPDKGEVCGDGKDQDCDSKDAACPLTCTQAAWPCISACAPNGIPTNASEIACMAKCTAGGPFVSAAAKTAWSEFQGCITSCADGECVQSKCPAKVEACIGSEQSQATCADLASCRLGCEPLNLAGLGPQYASCLAACPQDVLDPTSYQHVGDLIACGGACVPKLTCAATEKSPTSTCKAADMSCFGSEQNCNAAYKACFNP